MYIYMCVCVCVCVCVCICKCIWMCVLRKLCTYRKNLMQPQLNLSRVISYTCEHAQIGSVKYKHPISDLL